MSKDEETTAMQEELAAYVAAQEEVGRAEWAILRDAYRDGRILPFVLASMAATPRFGPSPNRESAINVSVPESFAFAEHAFLEFESRVRHTAEMARRTT